MAVDPLVQVLLDQMAAHPRPKPWDVAPEQSRTGFREMMKAFGPKDVPVGKVENLTMPGPGGEIALRTYRPVAAGGEALPALIYYHGGSFRVGDLDTHESVCRILAAESGARVIAVDYRLSPEHIFPAAHDDALAAARWVEANAAKLGIDPNRIAVGGDSAGGNLAASVCLSAKSAGAPHIVCQLLMFPLTQFGASTASMESYAQGFQNDRDMIEFTLGEYAARESWNDTRLSPLLAPDLSGLPPAYLLLAECDPLHDEGRAYGEKLRDSGVSVTLADRPGQIHCFTYYQTSLPQAREALVAAAKHLKFVFEAA